MNNYWKNKKVLVTGGAGFLGKHVVNLLNKEKVAEVIVPRSKECDLTIFENCERITKDIDVVIHLAAKVGGVKYNLEKPGEIYYQNTIMDAQMMEASRQNGVKKFVGIGTICSYPKNAPIPLIEKDLWDGYPEETKVFYGLAKKNLITQSKAYRQQYGFNSIVLLPVNLYGPDDKFDELHSHVIPALIKRFYEAKKNNLSDVLCRATGKATREFLYVTDAARGILLAAEKYNKSDPVNLGSSFEIVIEDLTKKIARMIGYKGKIVFVGLDSKNQIRKRLDNSKSLKEFGYKAKVDFEDGLKKTILWYKKEVDK